LRVNKLPEQPLHAFVLLVTGKRENISVPIAAKLRPQKQKKFCEPPKN
jgi:hypothetical protein